MRLSLSRLLQSLAASEARAETLAQNLRITTARLVRANASLWRPVKDTPLPGPALAAVPLAATAGSIGADSRMAPLALDAESMPYALPLPVTSGAQSAQSLRATDRTGRENPPPGEWPESSVLADCSGLGKRACGSMHEADSTLPPAAPSRARTGQRVPRLCGPCLHVAWRMASNALSAHARSALHCELGAAVQADSSQCRAALLHVAQSI